VHRADQDGPGKSFSAVKVSERTDVTMVENLKVGEKIQGLDERKEKVMCTVEAVGIFGETGMYGNYTADHAILSKETEDVMMHGKEGILSEKVKAYNILISCPLGIDESGVAFAGFAPWKKSGDQSAALHISWSDYLVVYYAIVTMVKETETYWYSSDSYKNRGIRVLVEMRPVLEEELIGCINTGDCDALETAVAYFIENYMNGEATETTMNVLASLEEADDTDDKEKKNASGANTDAEGARGKNNMRKKKIVSRGTVSRVGGNSQRLNLGGFISKVKK
jgi:hypothetical protein